MTRKHFEAFANALASHEIPSQPDASEDWTAGYEAARQDIGRTVAAILRGTNERFDAERFFAAAKLS